MVRYSLGLLALLVAVALAWTGNIDPLRAQQSSGAPSTEVGLDVSIRSDEGMSGPQQLAWVRDQTEQARIINRQVQSMLDHARKEKDTLKITCLDDKLTQIHVNLKGVEERSGALEVAIRGGDTPAANQQFTILQIYFSRIQGLKAEAEACIGDVDIYLGQTETTVTIDEDITQEDPSQSPPDIDIVVVQPPHASGFY